MRYFTTGDVVMRFLEEFKRFPESEEEFLEFEQGFKKKLIEDLERKLEDNNRIMRDYVGGNYEKSGGV